MPMADDFTVDDIVVKSANDLFTDREEPRKAFWDVYNSMVPGDYTAIAYYGVGGIGKTTLLRKLAQEIDEKIPESKGFDHITYSFEDYTTKEAFLFNLSRQMKLRNKGLTFPVFDEAITKICREGSRDIEKLKADAVASFSANPLVDTALSIAGEFLPGIGTVTKLAERIVEFGNTAVNEYDRKHGKNSVLYNQILYSDNKTIINDYLHEYFIYDVNEIMKKRTRPLVIFLDGYERYVDVANNAELTEGKDNWLHFVRKRLVNIPNTLWVVAGRELIKWKEDVLPPERLHRVGDLSEYDASEYFEKAGIDDEELVSQLHKLCHGTPVYMDLCVKSYMEISKTRIPVLDDFGKDTSDLAQRYLGFMDKPTRRLLELIAWLPNIWTKTMIEDTACRVNYSSYLPELDTILKLSLVEPIDLGYKLHETCRDAARAVCDNSECIQNAIVDYFKQKILDLENKEDKFVLLSQLFEVLEYTNSVKLSEEDFGELLTAYEDIVARVGNYQDAIIIIQKILAFTEREMAFARIRLRCGNIYVNLLNALGKYDMAHELAVSNWENEKEGVPEECKEILDALNNIAVSYLHIGNYSKAKELLEEHYKECKRRLGDEDHTTLTVLNNLATVYDKLGNYRKAEELHELCYKTNKQIFGEEHLYTLSSLNNLATVYGNLGYDAKAIEQFETCYGTRKRVLGEEHSDTLVTLINLATAYGKGNDWKKGIELLEVCYETQKETLGEEHPNTLRCLNALATIYANRGNKGKAIEILKLCYEMYKQKLGEEHPDTLTVLNNLATAQLGAQMILEAIELLELCYDTRKRVLGEEHPDTLLSAYTLAIAYVSFDFRSAAMLKKGSDLLEGCYNNIKEKFGEEHTGTLLITEYLAGYYSQLASLPVNASRAPGIDYSRRAKELQELCYEIQKRVLGEEHASTIGTLHGLVLIYFQRHDNRKIIELGKLCYDVEEKVLGEEHPNTIQLREKLIVTYFRLKEYKKVAELGKVQYERNKCILGSKHTDTVFAGKKLAIAYYYLGEYDSAKKIVEECPGIMQTFEYATDPEEITFYRWILQIL